MLITVLITALSLSATAHPLPGDTGTSNGARTPLSAQRVRREIRELSDTEREAVFEALNIMKNTSDAAGKAKYGHRFVNYDTLAMIHFVASSDSRGDMAHLGPGFPTFHRAFGLMAEESLMTISSLITALPYWDYNIDYHHPRNSIIWSWFGDSEGDPANLNAVTNGRFGHWRIPNMTECEPNCFGFNHTKKNPFGLMRSPWNNNPSPHLTRHSKSCGADVNFDTCRHIWGICLDMPTYETYLVCINPGVHTHAHGFLGGIWNADDRPVLDRFGCFYEHTYQVASAWTTGCVECPERCSDPLDLEVCKCGLNKTVCEAHGQARSLFAQLSPVATMGDFADTWTSANEPIFFFHHANIDRHVTIWQAKHKSKAPYYGYPKKWTGAPSLPGLPGLPPNAGQDLDAVISDATPFDPTLVGLPSSHGPLKHSDLIQVDGHTAFTPYTYDRLTEPYWPPDRPLPSMHAPSS